MSRTTAEPALWNLANILTLSRVGLGVLVLVSIQVGAYAGALVVFAVAAVTDALDGIAARRMGQVTAIGRQLDPLVDKLVIAAVLIFLLPVPEAGLPAWMVALIVARELLIQWLRSFMEGRGEDFGAARAGKLKTVFQCLAIVAILFVLAFRPESTPLRLARDLLLWSAVLLTAYSGLAYFIWAWPRLSQSSAR